MATDYFTGHQSYAATSSLPTPEVTPSGTPLSLHSSMTPRFNSRRSTSPRQLPLESVDWNAAHQEHLQNGSDAAQLPPSIHASLVSEVLSLRRELGSKNGLIDQLETDLVAAKSETESLGIRLSESAKETRAADRRVDHIEQETYNVVESIVKERDDALDAATDLRRKVEASSGKTKKHEEEVTRAYQRWEQEKQGWHRERGQLEQKLALQHTRLQALAEELSTLHAWRWQGQDNNTQPSEDWREGGMGNETDTASIRSFRTHQRKRTRSIQSLVSIPTSPSSPVQRRKSVKGTASSLADELDVEEEDDFDLIDPNLYNDRVVRPGSQQAQQHGPEAKARKILGMTGTSVDHSSATGKSYSFPPSKNYVDRGMQTWNNIPPGEAKASSQHDSGTWPTLAGLQDDVPASNAMISTARQSANEIQYSFAYTQVNTPPVAAASSSNSTPLKVTSLSLAIPSIAIHPPLSAPSSPRATVLPPGTKSIACQTDKGGVAAMSNACVQTKEIRVDMRRAKLPVHLLGTAFDGREDAALAHAAAGPDVRRIQSEQDGHQFTIPRNQQTRPGKLHLLKALPLPQPILCSEIFEVVEDEPLLNGPLSRSQQYGIQRPLRPSTFLADLHQDYDNDSDEFDEVQHTAGDRDTMGSGRVLIKSAIGRPRSALPPVVVEDVETSSERTLHESPPTSNSVRGPQRIGLVKQHSDRVLVRAASKDGRRQMTSLKSSHTYMPQHCSRSPSIDTVGSSVFSVQSRPPIPTRSSSRALDNWSCPPTPSPSDGGSLGSRYTQRSPPKARVTGLRKVQSATVMRPQARMSPRRRRRAPQLTPIQSMAFEGPVKTEFSIPEIPDQSDGMISPVAETSVRQESNRATGPGPSEDDAQDNSMVDAIASAMIGEYMYKYVSKRKSFGQMADASKDFSEDGTAKSNVTRHKRWVWISPYEKTIMWNAKQPANGSALMGKTGRKLTIKSVLDVKDSNPAPKGASTEAIFDRSIVVLTPTRALKFTATSRERHYNWLMALSFLANPSQGPPQVPRLPSAGPLTTKSQDEDAKASTALLEQSVGEAQNRTSQGQQLKAKSFTKNVQPVDPPRIAKVATNPQPLVNRHTRNRSSTGPPAPAPFAGLRSLSSSVFVHSPSRFTFGSASASSSRQSASPTKYSRQTTLTTVHSADFVEEQGIISMDAFVDPGYEDGVLYVPPRMPAATTRQSSQSSMSTYDRARAGHVFDADGRDNPFHGF